MSRPARSRSKVCDLSAAVAVITDHQAVACTGVLGWITPDAVLRALGERFERTGSPRQLTFYFPCAVGDAMGIGGMDHVARPGLMARIISGSYINPRHPVTGARPALTELIRNDLVQAHSWPIGASMHWLREVARGSPGYLTRIGLGTYIDPRHGGGRFTPSARDGLVEVVRFRGEEFLFYPSWPLDVAILRASSADEHGNLSFEDLPLTSANLALALAVKASGGTVIAQVGRIVPRGSRAAQQVRIPGALVDHVVPVTGQPVGTDVLSDPGYLAPVPDAVQRLPRLPAGADKVIARRVSQELRVGETTILGFGGSSDAILAMAEDGSLDGGRVNDYVFTTEHGPFGGVVMNGWQFSANYSPEALLDGGSQFDFIHGGGCDFAVLAFAQIDADGNVNVSRFGEASPGGGGFTDIAESVRRLVFAGTFTTQGLQVSSAGGRLSVRREGKVTKFVPEVELITYRAGAGVRRGQQARIITERAVFDITADGIVLIEIAPGIDLHRDLLRLMGFPVILAENLRTMDPALFRP
ncbi:MAG TPA: CoA-transferase [Jatrophihabitans sp.]|jgi:propionate CoA-transferase|uniref:CoA-transferase n=1 Tax=Jatrophihabitans sp. TaxID=1932789 RepID=UPI002F10C83A